MSERKYVNAYSKEASGSSLGQFGIKIMIAVDRELTETDGDSVSQLAEQIERKILEESARLSPKVQEAAKDEREGLLAAFGGAKIFVEEIPNGYFDSWHTKHLPWFVVTTIKGRIKIGWRKRVINIDWEDSTIKTKAKDLFPNEDTTKEDRYIHAWGYDKAAEYINTILTAE